MKYEQRKEIISNIIKNTVNKVFVVSWTDSYDYSWLDEFGIDRIAVLMQMKKMQHIITEY